VNEILRGDAGIHPEKHLLGLPRHQRLPCALAEHIDWHALLLAERPDGHILIFPI
jgi:hypothetical protein